MSVYQIPAGRYGDTSTAFIQAYIDQKIANVIDLAPETLNSLNEIAAAIGDDANFVTTVNDAIAAVQADVNLNETTAANLVSDLETARNIVTDALSGRLDTLEADPTTQTYVDGINTALDGRLNTLEADPTTQTAVDLKAPIADPTFTGDVSFGSLGRVNPSGNELKFLNDSMSSGIVLGNKITLQSNTEVEVFGDFVIESGLIDAADDTAAAAAGVDVNQLYRNGSVVMIRVS